VEGSDEESESVDIRILDGIHHGDYDPIRDIGVAMMKLSRKGAVMRDLEVLEYLSDGKERTFKEIREAVDVPRSTTRDSLKRLKEKGSITSRSKYISRSCKGCDHCKVLDSRNKIFCKNTEYKGLRDISKGYKCIGFVKKDSGKEFKGSSGRIPVVWRIVDDDAES
jgi:DNA-binding transcriptional ArsR family regulator